MKNLKQYTMDLLAIHGVSGDEGRVSHHLQTLLADKMDTLTVDHYGNLLLEKAYGDGKGATVLLSSHMDTVPRTEKERTILEQDGVIKAYNAKGNQTILGADDRAGIAAILTILERVPREFNGTLKVAFSREEEIGCVGATHIDPDWYHEVDLAIILDRRGNRDIVVGTMGTPFCCNEVGHFIEQCSENLNSDFRCVEGGISDALVFSEEGVNAVNLSIGYENEHTEKEFVVLNDMKKTIELVGEILKQIQHHHHTFSVVPLSNEWVPAERYPYDYGAEFDPFSDQLLMLPEVDGVLLVKEGNEIYLTAAEMKLIAEQWAAQNTRE